MRVLMFGWEFPPYLSGGLGTACYSMTKALAGQGTQIIFVMPNSGLASSTSQQGFSLRSASGVRVDSNHSGISVKRSAEDLWEGNLVTRSISSILTPYATPQSYEEQMQLMHHHQRLTEETQHHYSSTSDVIQLKGGYGADLMSEVYRYSLAAATIALESDFDVIHAHDWMTYPAAMLAKRLTGKPLVAHMHAMEKDRSGSNMNSEIAHIEWAGLDAADKVVAVSHYTKSKIIEIYKIPAEKIEVVHNAVSRETAASEYNIPPLMKHEKRVLFMGRVTYQKGPDYFVEAARKVLDRMKNVRFIMAGSGDMLPGIVRRVAQLRMGSRFHFTGFLKGEDVDRMYAMSDLYVMPSVSEPFGIAPLEAMLFDIPVLITRQSGVSEVIQNALKVDFWDVQGMADKICSVLSSPALATEIVRNSHEELKNIKWENTASLLNRIYQQLTCRGY